MPITGDHPMIALAESWARHFGYYDNRIDPKVKDLSAFTTPGAELIAHAPLWGIKEGVQTFPVAHVRKRLGRALRVGRATRHDMHAAVHPDGTQLCLFFELKMRLRLVRIPLQTTTLAFVVVAAETADGLRIDQVHEWAAANPDEARQAVINHHNWSSETELVPHLSFGALS